MPGSVVRGVYTDLPYRVIEGVKFEADTLVNSHVMLKQNSAGLWSLGTASNRGLFIAKPQVADERDTIKANEYARVVCIPPYAEFDAIVDDASAIQVNTLLDFAASGQFKATAAGGNGWAIVLAAVAAGSSDPTVRVMALPGIEI